MNKVQLIGYLGKDPVYHSLKDGKEMAYLRLATDHWYHQANGEPQKHTSWHGVSLWSNEQVKNIKDYLIKGSHIMVEGRLVYRHFTDKHGIQKHITEIKATLLIDLDR